MLPTLGRQLVTRPVHVDRGPWPAAGIARTAVGSGPLRRVSWAAPQIAAFHQPSGTRRGPQGRPSLARGLRPWAS